MINICSIVAELKLILNKNYGKTEECKLTIRRHHVSL